MTPTNLIAIVAVAVSCATALLVGYWHRKQLRQIELYRKDPGAGVVSPPSAITAFFRAHLDTVFGVVVPLGSLVTLLLTAVPLNRLSVLLISFHITAILLNIIGIKARPLLALWGDYVKYSVLIFAGQTTQIGALQRRIEQLEALTKQPPRE